MELSPRRRRMLKHVVEEYVATAVPVSSDIIVRRYEPTLSSATVRNELAQLEELGLISHPHTSAGRVPTDAGYRFFVEHLMASEVPTPGEQRTIRHQFHQVEPDVDRWAHLASSVLANAVRTAAVVTPLTSSRARVRRVGLLRVQDTVALVTVVLHSGAVRQHIVHLDTPSERDDLDCIGNKLTDVLDGRTATAVTTLAEGLGGAERQAALAVARILEQADRQTFEGVYYEGLGHVLSQPEFTYSQKAVPLVQVLERSQMVGKLLSEALHVSGVQVVIGAEHPIEEMRETSAVLA
ncbi:MAG: heat-inducible transcription repressor HrcA, partial [Chloroflexi bacterium]|nr:heat-inducible transcription repressor HrcA [Chloroflexota bacterium]